MTPTAHGHFWCRLWHLRYSPESSLTGTPHFTRGFDWGRRIGSRPCSGSLSLLPRTRFQEFGGSRTLQSPSRVYFQRAPDLRDGSWSENQSGCGFPGARPMTRLVSRLPGDALLFAPDLSAASAVIWQPLPRLRGSGGDLGHRVSSTSSTGAAAVSLEQQRFSSHRSTLPQRSHPLQ